MNDDRITCDQCRNLSASECNAFDRRFGPVLDLWRRCELFVPRKDAGDQRPGRERWPTLYAEYVKDRAERSGARKEAAQRGIERAKRVMAEQ